jgi:DNA repair protein RecN (Recombination protein N)
LKQNLSKQNKLKKKNAKIQLRELYEFQYEELTQAKLDLTEDSKLQQEYDYLSKAREIMEISLGIYSSLYVQEGSAYDKINQALSQLNRYSELSPKLSKICETISEVLVHRSSATSGDLGEEVSHDQSRLSAIRERLDLLNQLMHKHKLANLQALLEHRDQIASFLKDYSTQGRQIDELEQTVKSDFIILKANADGLSSARQEAAQRL